jgi:hypothetical protein
VTTVPRQTFLVHVIEGGPQAVVVNVATQELRPVADVRDAGIRISQWVDETQTQTRQPRGTNEWMQQQ